MTFKGEDLEGGHLNRKKSVLSQEKDIPFKAVEPFKSKFVMNDVSFGEQNSFFSSTYDNHKKSGDMNFHHAMMKNTISSIRREESQVNNLLATPFENSLQNKEEENHS